MSQPITKIDVTPLVSVALILVIIFIVTSPMIMSPPDSSVELPKAVTVPARSEKNILVTFDTERRLAVNDHWVRRSQFEQALKDELSLNPDGMVLIRADKKVKHGDIVDLLHRAKRAGAGHIALATEQKNRADL